MHVFDLKKVLMYTFLVLTRKQGKGMQMNSFDIESRNTDTIRIDTRIVRSKL